MTADTLRAQIAAQKILTDYKVKKTPVPVERIIKAKGIVLEYAPLESELSGMAYIKDQVAIIGLNALHHPNRQRFSAAHELGHHELHSSQLHDAIHVDKGLRVLARDGLSSEGIDSLEIEANTFAAELLMPKNLLLDALDSEGLDIEDDESVEKLARKFRVSASAMRFRLASLV